MLTQGGQRTVEIHQTLLVAGGQGRIRLIAHHFRDPPAHDLQLRKMRPRILVGSESENVARFRKCHAKRSLAAPRAKGKRYVAG